MLTPYGCWTRFRCNEHRCHCSLQTVPTTGAARTAPLGRQRTDRFMQLATPQRAGLSAALLSAAAFGTSGAFATSLIDSGWSPAAAVTVRLLVAAAVLTIPAMVALRGQFGALARERRSIAGYG